MIYYSVVIEKNSCAIEMTISAICTVTVCNERDLSAKKIQVKKSFGNKGTREKRYR